MKISLCRDIGLLLTEKAYEVYSPCMYRPDYEKYTAFIGSIFPKSRVFISEDESICGILILDRNADIPEIVGIAVAEKYRGKGTGRALIRYAVSSERLCALFAQTDDDAVGFYLNCGFHAEKKEIAYPDGIAVRYDCIYIPEKDI